MRLDLFPHIVALLMAMAAFVLGWAAGLVCGVPADRIALRAIIGAAAFWLLGLLAGRAIFNVICDALSERLYADRSNETSRTGAKR